MRHLRPVLAGLLTLLVGIGGFTLASAQGTSAQGTTCSASATPSTLSAAVSAAQSGDTLCLATGSYGTWTGTGKQITLRAADGAVPTMKVNFGAGDQGFTLDGMQGMGGQITPGAHDLTIRNSAFTSQINVQGSPGANLVLDHNTHDWNASGNDAANSKIFVWSNSGGASSGLTIRNSHIANGGLDGIHIGGSAGVDIIGNVLQHLCNNGANHTDFIQTEGMVGGRIAGNLLLEQDPNGALCSPMGNTQALTSFDSGTVGVVIEDNVIDVRRPWGIEWYSDRNSIIRHNTLIYHAASQCAFNQTCGVIDVDRKTADPAGTGTQVYDNLTTRVAFTAGSTGTQHDNTSSQQAVYVGPASSWAGFALAPGSAGKGAASDGLDAGIRVGAAPDPTPTPSATPSPSPTATATPTPTATATATPSPSPSPTPTAMPSPVPTATPTPGYHPACEPDCDSMIASLKRQLSDAISAQHQAEADRDAAVTARNQLAALVGQLQASVDALTSQLEDALQQRDAARSALADLKAAWATLRAGLEP